MRKTLSSMTTIFDTACLGRPHIAHMVHETPDAKVRHPSVSRLVGIFFQVSMALAWPQADCDTPAKSISALVPDVSPPPGDAATPATSPPATSPPASEEELLYGGPETLPPLLYTLSSARTL